MKAKPFPFGLFVLAALIHAAEAESTDAKPASFFIHAGRFERSYSCAAGVPAGYIEDGMVHANLRRGDDTYLLIAYSEMSRPNHPSGRCGSGAESYLVWLHVRGSTVIASQTEQYESCWKDISGSPVTWSGQFCTVEYEESNYNFDTKERNPIRYRASFDTKAPEKGIQVTSEPSEKVK